MNLAKKSTPLMKAMVLKEPQKPLLFENLPIPTPKKGELLIKVHACGVCRTDLHIKDGELKNPKLPLILGHEIVGTVVQANSQRFQKNDLVGVFWLQSTCGSCDFCKSGKENLCNSAVFTGYQTQGGFAEYTTCPEDFAIFLNINLKATQIAPMLCAGLIGYRAYLKLKNAQKIGFFGFGAAAHLLTQIATQEQKQVFAFTKKGDLQTQKFAKSIGAKWAGDSEQKPPEALDATILFAPVGEHIPTSLKILKKGGQCICAGIHMSDIPPFPYADLWGEKSIESVANLTRKDAALFFEKIKLIQICPSITVYELKEANRALDDLKAGRFDGAAVLKVC